MVEMQSRTVTTQQQPPAPSWPIRTDADGELLIDLRSESDGPTQSFIPSVPTSPSETAVTGNEDSILLIDLLSETGAVPSIVPDECCDSDAVLSQLPASENVEESGATDSDTKGKSPAIIEKEAVADYGGALVEQSNIPVQSDTYDFAVAVLSQLSVSEGADKSPTTGTDGILQSNQEESTTNVEEQAAEDGNVDGSGLVEPQGDTSAVPEQSNVPDQSDTSEFAAAVQLQLPASTDADDPVTGVDGVSGTEEASSPATVEEEAVVSGNADGSALIQTQKDGSTVQDDVPDQSGSTSATPAEMQSEPVVPLKSDTGGVAHTKTGTKIEGKAAENENKGEQLPTERRSDIFSVTHPSDTPKPSGSSTATAAAGTSVDVPIGRPDSDNSYQPPMLPGQFATCSVQSAAQQPFEEGGGHVAKETTSNFEALVNEKEQRAVQDDIILNTVDLASTNCTLSSVFALYLIAKVANQFMFLHPHHRFLTHIFMSLMSELWRKLFLTKMRMAHPMVF